MQIEGSTTTTVNVTNNEFAGNQALIAGGVLSQGYSSGIHLMNFLATGSVVNIRNNNINGFVFGVHGEGVVSGTEIHVNFNNLTGNSNEAVLNVPPFIANPDVIGVGQPPFAPPVQPPPDVFDLQDNWWDALTPAAIAALISGNPTPTAWLTSGIDTNPFLTGFQPDLDLVAFSTGAVNQAPVLAPIGDQSIFRNSGSLSLTLTASEVNSVGGMVSNPPPLTYNAFLATAMAFQLDQQLQLNLDAGGVYTNCFRAGEKWLRGLNNQFGNPWYYILPGGQLYAWDGSHRASGMQVGTLTPTYNAHPNLLYQAATPVPVGLQVSGNALAINPGTFAGTFEIVIQASDGNLTSTKSLTVTVINRAPQITPTAPQTLAAGQNQLVIPIIATDPDNDPLSSTAVAGNAGVILKQTYQLVFAGSLYSNYGGAHEEWLQGAVNSYGNTWYFIKPSGQFFAWDGTILKATGTLLDTVDPVYYVRPDLIYNGQPQSLPYALSQSLNLRFTGNYYQNYGKAGEKWLTGNVNQYGNSWYFLLPGGQLYAWNGARNQAAGTLIASLDVSLYNQPQLLYAAQSNAVTVTMAGNNLTISRAAGFTGNIDVAVFVSDGFATVTDHFRVSLL